MLNVSKDGFFNRYGMRAHKYCGKKGGTASLRPFRTKTFLFGKA